jgi:hypothetical protein
MVEIPSLSVRDYLAQFGVAAIWNELLQDRHPP